MTLLHSLPALLSMIAAILLTLWGSVSKSGSVVRFAGALCGGFAVVWALIDGALLQEALLYMMVLLLLSLRAQRPSSSENEAPKTQHEGEHTV